MHGQGITIAAPVQIAEAAAFVRSSDPKLFSEGPLAEDTTSGPGAPDIEIFFSPLSYIEHGDHHLPSGHYFGLHTVLLRFADNLAELREVNADPVIDRRASGQSVCSQAVQSTHPSSTPSRYHRERTSVAQSDDSPQISFHAAGYLRARPRSSPTLAYRVH